jgi:hypothetical protein
MPRLLFTHNSQTYAMNGSGNGAEDYLATDISDAVNYINAYRPDTITIDYTVGLSGMIECLNAVKRNIYYCPTVVISEDGGGGGNSRHYSPKYARIPPELDHNLDFMLCRLNFATRLKGYEYIKRCVFEGIYNPHSFSSVKKCLYDGVAGVFGTSVYSVERGINFSIKKAYERSKGNPELITDFEVNGKLFTNTEFLNGFLIKVKYERGVKRNEAQYSQVSFGYN